MKKFISILTLLIISLGASTMVAAQEANQMRNTVQVVGVGEVKQAPDQAIIEISITARKPKMVEAKAVADERYKQVLSVLKKHQIKDEEVKNTQLSAQPEYDWRNGDRVYKGERVTRRMSITVNDLGKLPELMQGLVENGASTIDNVSTGFKDKSELMMKALAAAVDDAKAKAEFLAKRLGRSLGEAVLIQEQNRSAPHQYQDSGMLMKARAESADEAPQEMFGLQSVNADITVYFNLL